MPIKLDHYVPGPLEFALTDFYRKSGVRHPNDIDVRIFASCVDAQICMEAAKTKSMRLRNGQPVIIVDNRIPLPQQRVELARELGKILLQRQRIDSLSGDEANEADGNPDVFAMYALAPTFMIARFLGSHHNRFITPRYLAYQFGVPDAFMETRLLTLELRARELTAKRTPSLPYPRQNPAFSYTFRHPVHPNVEYLVRDGHVVGRRRLVHL